MKGFLRFLVNHEYILQISFHFNKISLFLQQTKTKVLDYLKRDIKTIKIALLIIASVVVLFVLRLFSFIFIPFFLAMFFALILLPVLNWFEKKKIPYWLGVFIIVVSSVLFLWINAKILQSTTTDLLHSKDEIISEANHKINPLLVKFQHFIGVKSVAKAKSNTIDFNNLTDFNTRDLISRVSHFFSGLFMMLFFLALFLTGAHVFEDFLNRVTNHDIASIQVYREIKGALSGFVKVKFITSFITGIGFGLVTLMFGVKFVLFWGLLAFLLNFIQVIGSFVITTTLLLFGFVEIKTTGHFIIFGLLITGIQVIVGGILEPILMGKNFKINTITVLISIAIWGFIFGIVGLILAIPIAVFLKIVLEKIPATKSLAQLMSRVRS